MGMPGMGVMIHQLFGNDNEGRQALTDSLGKSLRVLRQEGDTLKLAVNGGPLLELFDNGQSCCESRYMRTDDDPEQFIGATLVSVEVRDAPSVEAEHEEHEVQFLVVITDRGNVTFSNHNEHNGYYGGFAVTVKRGEEPQPAV